MDIEEIVTTILAALGLAGTIAAITPNQSDNVAIQFIYRLINLLGQNVGNAKNKD